MDYTDVVNDLFTYNMASAALTIQSNGEWRHCHPTYGDRANIKSSPVCLAQRCGTIL